MVWRCRAEYESRALIDMSTGHALGNSAENFIRDSIRKRCVFPGVDAQAIGRAEQNNFISNGNSGKPGNVGESQIHGNPSYDGRIVLSYNYTALRRDFAI